VAARQHGMRGWEGGMNLMAFFCRYGRLRVEVVLGAGRACDMAQILQPFQVAVNNFSDSINSFFGVGEAPHTPQPLSAVAVSVVENDPHHFSSARWLQEIER
jgi:hypothetical protein